MALQTGDIIAYRSSQTSSDGGSMSTTPVATAPLNNIWIDFTDGERVSGVTRYRKMFWKNTSGSDEMIAPIMYAPVLPDGPTLYLGLGFDDANDSDPLQGNMIAVNAASVVELVSSGTDSRNVSVWGVNDGGVPVSETLTLSSTTAVHTVAAFQSVWAVNISTLDATQTVTVHQGISGNTIGTIGPNKSTCFLWIAAPTAKASGIALPDLPAGASYGMWERLVLAAASTALRPDNLSVAIEEA